MRSRCASSTAAVNKDLHRTEVHCDAIGSRTRRTTRHSCLGQAFMKPNLDTLKREIPEYLQSKGLAIFHGFVNELHEQRLAFWDLDLESDYRAFVEGAVRVGVQLVV